MAWAVAQLEAQQRAEQEMEDQLNSVAKSFSALLGVAPPTDSLAVAPGWRSGSPPRKRPLRGSGLR